MPCGSICLMSRATPSPLMRWVASAALRKRSETKALTMCWRSWAIQGTLHDSVRLFLASEAVKPVSIAISEIHREADAGHGRVEPRKCIVSSELDWLEQKPVWSGLTGIARLRGADKLGGASAEQQRAGAYLVTNGDTRGLVNGMDTPALIGPSCVKVESSGFQLEPSRSVHHERYDCRGSCSSETMTIGI